MSDTTIGTEVHDDSPDHSEPVLEVQGLTKSFGPLSVLRGVDMTLHRGEVLGLVGDNGAGKSTLVKIISGLFSQDSGRVLVNGNEVHFRSVPDATAHGIETVYQDLALVPQLPVYLNLFLNHELTFFGPMRLLDKRTMRELAEQYFDDINVNVPNVNAEAGQLSGGQRQAIAVARATRADAKILLLDEPLAAMGARESRLIIDLVKDLASTGKVSIIIIDHNYAHLFQLCDRVNVMQGGRITIDRYIKDTSLEELTEVMVSSYRSQIQDVAASTPVIGPRPPRPVRPERRSRVGLRAGVAVAVVVLAAVIAIVASNVGNHSSKSTTSTTRAPTTTTLAVPPHKVVVALSGSGILKGASFRVSSVPWSLAWSYSCKALGNPGNFIAQIKQGSSLDAKDKEVNELGLKGAGVSLYHDTGSFTLRIISECKWAVRVKNG